MRTHQLKKKFAAGLTAAALALVAIGSASAGTADAQRAPVEPAETPGHADVSRPLIRAYLGPNAPTQPTLVTAADGDRHAGEQAPVKENDNPRPLIRAY